MTWYGDAPLPLALPPAAAGSRQRWCPVARFSPTAMTLATIDRLVHHATILEMNVESYRRRAALQRKRGKTVQPS
jgi:hypothetical protein